MSLKHKLTWIFALALTLVMVVTSLIAQTLSRVAVEEEIREQVDAAAVDMIHALERESVQRGYLTTNNAQAVVAQALLSHPNLKSFDLMFMVNNVPQGFRLPLGRYSLALAGEKAEGGKSAGANPPRPERTFRSSYSFTLLGQPARLGLEASLTEADQLANRLARTFLLVSGGALLAMIALIYYLAHRLVSEPLSELFRVTRRVAAGDLEVVPASRLEVRRDEVGVLANAFQEMLSALRRARDENQTLLLVTQGFNRELEARVQDATGALAEKNQALETINEALIEAREELSRRERLAALGQLAGSIAHEIGTPLSTLSGYLQLVLADPKLAEELKEPIQVASGEAARMTRIIRRFLDSTRGLRPVPESVDLKGLIHNVVDLTVPEGARGRHPARLELAPEVATPMTDPGLLRQVLINLVNNALDAMGDSGALTFRGTREEGELVLEVEDEGPGVPVEAREQIFAPFYTTKEAGRGTGLGLAICREIVRALQGTLTVDQARSGSGARFVLRIPAFG